MLVHLGDPEPAPADRDDVEAAVGQLGNLPQFGGATHLVQRDVAAGGVGRLPGPAGATSQPAWMATTPNSREAPSGRPTRCRTRAR
ncbi:hypothetical protein GCM10027614_26080 [Micromonospora vulcania]